MIIVGTGGERVHVIPRVTAVRMVSWIHGTWGATILMLPTLGLVLPRPFGSFEAYLAYMPGWVLAVIFLATAALSSRGIKWIEHHPKWAAAAVVPQQLILLWGVMWAVLMMIDAATTDKAIDVRGFLGASYLAVLSTFHALDVARIYSHAFAAQRRGGHV